MTHDSRIPVVVLGAGPAGLGAAWKLAARGKFDVTVVERQNAVGGNAGSFELEGLHVDYGSHRLHPSIRPDILADIRGMLGSDLLDRPRHGRIRLGGRWLHFPLKPVDLAVHLPVSFTAGAALDSIRKLVSSGGTNGEESFASVLERGLGRTICREFYFPYAEKIWGMQATELDAEQARRRVSAGSVGKMVRRVLNAVPGFKPRGSGRFFYPRGGYGQISEGYRRKAESAGARIMLGTELLSVETEDGHVMGVIARRASGDVRLPCRLVLSTIPIVTLVRSLGPHVPDETLRSAAALRSRAMLLVYLVLDTDRFTEFDAHYFPGIDVPFTRMHEPKNYSLADIRGTTVLCVEFPCSPGDNIWSLDDQALGRLVLSGLQSVDLSIRAMVRRVVTRRAREAYPIYERGYRVHFDRLDEAVRKVGGLLALGRQGLFAHDNTHHTLDTAYAAVECVDDTGAIATQRWEQHRRDFEKHVVED
jgi:protoporphyrinogen oxidase